MSPSTTSDSSVSPVTKSNNAESNLQPFFILQKSLPQLSEKRPAGSVKTRRRIDLSQASPKEKSNAFQAVEGDSYVHKHVPVEAFEDAWSNIENTIKGRFRQINDDLFEEICCWIDRSFKTIKSSGAHKISEVTRPYSTVLDTSDKQIFTALMLTKNVEFVDDLLTFEELRVHLKSHSFHVASLSSADFCMKDGVGRCLRSLLWQLVAVSVEVADIAILAAWYIKAENYDKPVVVIIDDMERCNGSVLADFIALLSQWVVKIPIILLVGVATTVDAPAKLLPSNTLQHLQPCKFTMGSPLEKLDAIIEDVLVKQNIGFNIGYSVAAFLKNYFLKHDGTITSFIRAIKIARVKHFLLEPLSFLGNGMLEEDEQDFWKEKCETLPDELLKHAFALPSSQREEDVGKTRDDLALGLSKLKRTREKWGSVVMVSHHI
ncbi:origin of replication complex subunit 3 [Aristolochia californica]|uniref:origin of replication complex subunit 3 n=1 Tax=Aristolochia californica TaxID=171875 RepID=UPI0035D83487